MNVVLLSGDLMTVSRVQGAATRIDVELHAARDLEQALDYCQNEQVGLVVIDLTTLALGIDAVVTQLKASTPATSAIVAFGPHVHAERLEAARQAGCDDVVSRGQFFAHIDVILQRRRSD